jgi:hypothetical protein
MMEQSKLSQTVDITGTAAAQNPLQSDFERSDSMDSDELYLVRLTATESQQTQR